MLATNSPKQPNIFNTDAAEKLGRMKIKEEEIKLLRKRLKICDSIIKSSIKLFTAENIETFKPHKNKVHIHVDRMEKENYAAYYKMQHHITSNNSLIMGNCIKFIETELQNWNKYTTNKNINNFEQYFQSAENCWKVETADKIALYFRTSISATISQFTYNAAGEFFCGRCFDLQTSYANYLISLISVQMTMNPYLEVGNSKVQCEQKYNINLSHDRLRKANETHEMWKGKFQNSLLKLHYEVDNYGSSENNGLQFKNVQIPLETPGLKTDPISYGNHHQSNYKVKGYLAYRNDPLGRKNY